MYFGCIADDFTGASDIASFFTKGGLRTILCDGIPEKDLEETVDVCVIALKTRTEERNKAVNDSLKSIRWLKKQGAKQFYVKYCSTFDSTPKGNIGPINDAVMEELNIRYTIINPALPINGRTVKEGCLYVNGKPLHESPMKDHPLTPMWDYDLANLMNSQSKYTAVKIPKEYQTSKETVKEFVDKTQLDNNWEHFYLIPDFEIQEDAKKLTEQFDHLKLITGGSGLAEELAKTKNKTLKYKYQKDTDAPSIILSGSCSEMTRSQVEDYKKSGGLTYFMNPEKLITGKDNVNHIWNFIRRNKDKPVLIYSCDKRNNLENTSYSGRLGLAKVLEKTTAEIAIRAYHDGFYRIIVAGGETSGAVTQKLGLKAYEISESVAPGVPILIPLKDKRVRLVLKSGNFGQKDFFSKALSLI